MKILEKTLTNLISESGADAAVAMQTLDGNDELFINAETVFHAASTMKVAVMLELFRQVEQGKMQLTDRIPTHNEFTSIIDGSIFHQVQEYDTEAELYAAVEMSLYDLCHLMITISSNLVTNLIMRHVGRDNIQTTLTRAGIGGMTIIRYLEDPLAFERGINNDTDAKSLLNLLMSIAQHRILTPAS